MLLEEKSWIIFLGLGAVTLFGVVIAAWVFSTPPPIIPCEESWSCGAWSTCEENSQSRTCTDASACGTVLEKPSTQKSCIIPASCGDDICQSNENCSSCASDCGACIIPPCTENWTCNAWSGCSNGMKTRSCSNTITCATDVNKPTLSQSCTCTEKWSCSSWSNCSNNTQSRTCNDAQSCATDVNVPMLTRSCTIFVDTTPPAITLSFSPGDFQITINYTVTDDNSGIASIKLLKTDNSFFFNGPTGAAVKYKDTPAVYDSPVAGQVNAILFSGNSSAPTLNHSNSFLDEGVSNGTKYYYGMKACDFVGNCSINYNLAQPTPKGATITATLQGSPEKILEFDQDGVLSDPQTIINGCVNGEDAPDLPARAFKGLGGTQSILLIPHIPKAYATYADDSWSSGSISRQCNSPLLTSPYPTSHDLYADNYWLTSPYTNDGQNIFALAHNEYHAGNVGACVGGTEDQCTLYSIVGLQSTDGGLTFSPIPGFSAPDNHVVAAIPRVWPSAPTTPGYSEGFHVPSNIIKKDGYYYFMLNAIQESGNGNEVGACIFRTNNLFNPQSWKMFQWRDASFSSKGAVNPNDSNRPVGVYTGPNNMGLLMGPRSSWNLDSFFASSSYPLSTTTNQNDLSRNCGFVGRNTIQGVQSLTYNTYLKKFISVDMTSDCEAVFSTSPDLIHWSSQKILAPSTENCDSLTRHVYPSLLDPTDTSLSYEKTGQNPYLFWTQGESDGVHSYGIAYNSDSYRQQIQFSCSPSSC